LGPERNFLVAALGIETLVIICSAIGVGLIVIGIRLFWRRGKKLEDL